MEFKNIFFDLDGTLIDSRQRLYNLFCDITKTNLIDFNVYWKLKREKKSNEWILENILHYDATDIQNFVVEWMNNIETDTYLKWDNLFDNTLNSLKELQPVADLYLVTARQHPSKILSQIKNLQIDIYFKDVLVTEQKKSKTELIKNIEKDISSQSCLIVGDTGEDILIGKRLNMQTAAVLTGFRNKEILQSYNPDYIFDDLTSFTKFIKQTNE